MEKFFDSRRLTWIHSYIVTVVEEIYLRPTNLIKKARTSEELMKNINKPFYHIGVPYMGIFNRCFYFLQLMYKLMEVDYAGEILDKRNSETFSNFAKAEGISVEKEIDILMSWRSSSVTDRDVLGAYTSILLKAYRIEQEQERVFRIQIDDDFLNK